VLAEGWATPLDGFMRERQYLQALHFGQLLDTKGDGQARKPVADDVYLAEKGVNQSIPIVLTIDYEQKAAIGGALFLAGDLNFENGVFYSEHIDLVVLQDGADRRAQ